MSTVFQLKSRLKELRVTHQQGVEELSRLLARYKQAIARSRGREIALEEKLILDRQRIQQLNEMWTELEKADREYLRLQKELVHSQMQVRALKLELEVSRRDFEMRLKGERHS